MKKKMLAVAASGIVAAGTALAVTGSPAGAADATTTLTVCNETSDSDLWAWGPPGSVWVSRILGPGDCMPSFTLRPGDPYTITVRHRSGSPEQTRQFWQAGQNATVRVRGGYGTLAFEPEFS